LLKGRETNVAGRGIGEELKRRGYSRDERDSREEERKVLWEK